MKKKKKIVCLCKKDRPVFVFLGLLLCGLCGSVIGEVKSA